MNEMIPIARDNKKRILSDRKNNSPEKIQKKGFLFNFSKKVFLFHGY
jgi:hypothetical protein